MQPKPLNLRIREKALDLLNQHREGLRYSELSAKILEADPKLNSNTIRGAIWNLDNTLKNDVYKPSKGLFRLLKYQSLETGNIESALPDSNDSKEKIKEKDFYVPFADWLKYEIEDVTHAISLGGNKFRDKWGTPDVIGKYESKRSDIINAPIEIVSAEIKTDLAHLVTAFGQACSYKLFSHKVYLVIPCQAQNEEISRLDSLCQIFGIGLVTFNVKSVSMPDFRIRVRPYKQEPDFYYTNKYMRNIEHELFK
uniref:HTH HARE-type domain-containing protein n=1 Tax=Candidatus Nitrotoga fabula TaxID=2182327 RepID=A0A2X0RBQ3_9PROT|nr:conserved protein of unknown function [Candidatus Nitrotoga fabula]